MATEGEPLRRWAAHPVASGVFAVLAATLVRLPFAPWLENRVPFAFYFPALTWAAWRGGWVSGTVASVGSLILGTALFMRTNPQQPLVWTDGVAMLAFLAGSLAIVALGENSRRATRQRDRARAELLRLNRELELHVQERTAQVVEKAGQLEDFTHTVAHDLKSPIRRLANYSQILLQDEGPRLTPEGRHQLERMNASAQGLAELIDQLLEHIRTGKRELRRLPVDLAELFRDELRQIQAEYPKVRIQAKIAPHLMAECDPALVALVFRNLIANSVKYRRDTAHVEIEFGADGDRFYVRDCGTGFAPEDAERIFEPFERLHQNAAVAGTGIGLANVRRVIERHGGRIWAEGMPGEGATINFTLR